MKNTNRTNQNIDVLSRHSGREQGMALVTTLLLLTLLSAVTVGMVLAASSDELINGYYRNMRGSFYAADSGLNIVRQAMLNQIAAAVPANVTNPAVQPIPSGTDATVQSSILSTYGSNASLNSGQAANSWPESYRITEASLSLPPVGGCTVSGNGWSGTCTVPDPPENPACAPNDCSTARPTYTYNYTYSLKAVGLTHASEETTLTDRGNMMVTVNLTPTGPQTTSFAAWGMFIDQFAICSAYLVPGTITGPVFTNGAWTFGATNQQYIFTDPVGSVNANLGYKFPSTCKQSPNDPYTLGNQTINPDFQGGYQLDQPHVDLPQNDFSQKRAVLDGMGTDTTPVTNPQMNAVLQDVAGNPYPSTGASSGVFLPYSDSSTASCSTPPCMTGGGILVEGAATVTLTASTTDPDRQIITVLQGTTTTTVTVDLSDNTTTIAQSGFPNQVINGVPTQYDSGGSVVRDAAMIYVNGQINSLKGPGSNAAAIQDGHALTVVAATNIIVTDDIIYKTKPVTTTQNEIPGTPPSTIIPGNDNGQVLGLFTATGDIRMQNCSGCGNLEIDASIATISNGGTGGLVNTGSLINTLTIIGGRIQNNIKNINSTTRNVIFDRRFSQGGFAPPWFPSTQVTASGVSSTVVTPSIQRVQWLNQTPF